MYNSVNNLKCVYLRQVILILISVIVVYPVLAQDVNYDESLVSPYTLPNPLIFENGKPVKTSGEWVKKRRPELLRLFEDNMFGKSPGKVGKIRFNILSEDNSALNGTAIRREVEVFFSGAESPSMIILMYIPAKRKGPVPLYAGLNFGGNYTINADPGILFSDNAIAEKKEDELKRGSASSRWPVDLLIERGYALATIYCGDIDPDFDDGFANGVHPLFYSKGQTRPLPEQWGTIAAWAWGLSRAMDYFERDKDINSRQIAVIGHSRLGKAALWAGATDKRFSLVVSNNSGCGGAAIFRRKIGETVSIINKSFPHWFCENFKQYNNNEAALPVDQHELIALMAPRPVYIASAEEDLWADPKGEFLAGLHAGPVYRLFGLDGLPSDKMPEINNMPEVNNPVSSGYIGYHIRTGKHDITLYDWEKFLDFSDRHFGK